MSRGRTAIAIAAALAVLLAVSSGASTQDGTVVGRPDLDLTIPDNRVSGEEVVTLEAYLTNDGRVLRGGTNPAEREVTTARNVTVRPLPDELDGRVREAVEFRTGPVPVGTVPRGVTGPIRFTVAVGSLPTGEYRIPFAVNYSYVSYLQLDDPETLERTRTEVVNATLVVAERPRLRLSTPPDQTVSPGESDAYRFEVANVGTETAREVGVTLAVDNASVYFGTLLDRHAKTAVYLDELPSGETATVSVRLGADDSALPGSYLVAGSATYRDESGVVQTSDWLATGITVEEPNYSSSPAPSRTMTAIPVSKSAMASADSSARPTARSEPLSRGFPARLSEAQRASLSS